MLEPELLDSLEVDIVTRPILEDGRSRSLSDLELSGDKDNTLSREICSGIGSVEVKVTFKTRGQLEALGQTCKDDSSKVRQIGQYLLHASFHEDLLVQVWDSFLNTSGLEGR